MGDLKEHIEGSTGTQKCADQRFEQWARAQSKIDREFQRIHRCLTKVETLIQQLYGQLNYNLANTAHDVLPELLKTRYNVKVDKLYHANVVYSLEKGKYDEVNIFGEGFRNGQKVYVVGECKARFGVKNFRDMERMLKRVEKKLDAPLFPLVLAYQYHPRVEMLLKQHSIPYIWSYELKQDAFNGEDRRKLCLGKGVYLNR